MNCSHIDILDLLEEPEADRLQSLLWPLVEPVDRCAVDYCWELPAANPQFTANWRKTQSHLQYMHTHTYPKRQTGTLRSNRIKCQVKHSWSNSFLFLLIGVTVSTSAPTYPSSWSREGMEHSELIFCSSIIKHTKPPAKMWIKAICWAGGYVRLIFTAGDEQLACWEAQPDVRYIRQKKQTCRRHTQRHFWL